jgi:hypothetical protein
MALRQELRTSRPHRKLVAVPQLSVCVPGSGFARTFSEPPDSHGERPRARGQHAGRRVDRFVSDFPSLSSVTVHVQDIDRDRGYSTTAERKTQGLAGKSDPEGRPT